MVSFIAIDYVVVAVTIGIASSLLGPSPVINNSLYDIIQTGLRFFGNDETKSLAELQQNGEEAPKGLVVAFLFASSASLLTVLQLLSHLTKYTNPRRQRYAIRILLMVPIYAIDSFWSYLSFEDATWISIARDTYEAYVLYNFFAFLMDVLGGEDGCVELWSSHKMETLAHGFPINYFMAPMKLNKDTLWWWKMWLVQYMLLSPVITTLTYLAAAGGVFDESSYSFENTHVYLMTAKTVSVTVAFTCLFYLYLAIKVPIHHLDPTGKFISIKFVIFFSFWQYIGITTAASWGLLPQSVLSSILEWSHDKSNVEDQEVALCNLLMCFEMFVTAVMHHFVFSVDSVTRNNHTLKINNKATNEPVALTFTDALVHAASVDDLWTTTKVSAAELKEKKLK